MATSIYPTILSKIQTILESCEKVKKIYNYPVTNVEGYPAVIYFPINLDNSFETTQENFKIYEFGIWIAVSTGNIGIDEIYQRIMPNVIDEVIERFDSGWDFNTIDGHRVWQKLTTGTWETENSDKGIIVTANLNLQIKLLTNN